LICINRRRDGARERDPARLRSEARSTVVTSAL
jgi:hypothetical protein